MQINNIASEVYAHLERCAQELDEQIKDGKCFGYDIDDIETALKSSEGTMQLIDKLYDIDEQFGTDPAYYDVTPANMVIGYILQNHDGLTAHDLSLAYSEELDKIIERKHQIKERKHQIEELEDQMLSSDYTTYEPIFFDYKEIDNER